MKTKSSTSVLNNGTRIAQYSRRRKDKEEERVERRKREREREI